MSVCSIEGCDRPYYGRGWCSMHYKRWRHRGGDPAIALTAGGRPRGASCPVCGEPAKVQGYCSKHYKKLRKYGDPTITKIAARGEHQVFIEMALTYEGDDCLIWPFGTHGLGYGAVDGSTAHRAMCERAYGPAPDGKPYTIHSCDNPPCVNKRHLRWGSPADNVADMMQRKRHFTQKLLNQR